MAKFSVKVRVVKVLEKPMTIYAGSEEEAELRAAEIVLKWKDVEESQGFDAQKIEG